MQVGELYKAVVAINERLDVDDNAMAAMRGGGGGSSTKQTSCAVALPKGSSTSKPWTFGARAGRDEYDETVGTDRASNRDGKKTNSANRLGATSIQSTTGSR